MLAAMALLWYRLLNDGEAGASSRDGVTSAAAVLSASRAEHATSETVREAAACLQHVDLETLRDDSDRLAFWINVYNALIRHAALALRPSGTVITNLLLFERASYRIGPHRFSPNDIEHGVLRRNARALPLFRRRFASGDARNGLLVDRVDPRVHFALNCGAVSCPPVREWTPGRIEEQLELATAGYLRAHTTIDRERGVVTLSSLLSLYSADFGSRADAVRFTARYLPEEDAAWLLAHVETAAVRFGRYDWSLT